MKRIPKELKDLKILIPSECFRNHHEELHDFCVGSGVDVLHVHGERSITFKKISGARGWVSEVHMRQENEDIPLIWGPCENPMEIKHPKNGKVLRRRTCLENGGLGYMCCRGCFFNRCIILACPHVLTSNPELLGHLNPDITQPIRPH